MCHLHFRFDHFLGFLYRYLLIVVVNQLLLAFRHHCDFNLHSMSSNHFARYEYLSRERYHFEHRELSAVILIKNDHLDQRQQSQLAWYFKVHCKMIIHFRLISVV